MQKKNCNILLFGGGVDSTCLAYHLNDKDIDFSLLFIDYGQKAKAGELHSMKVVSKALSKKYDVISTNIFNGVINPLLNGSFANKHEDNFITLRNQVLFDIAIIYCSKTSCDKIFVGFHIEERQSKFYDAMDNFVKKYNDLLAVQKIKIKIVCPFHKQTQQQYIREHVNKNSIISLLNSFSCYESSTKKECGKCTHCQRKKELIESCRTTC
ncbi:MAG: 7-cyano-7-deazaguanine synthase [Saprospiraceae bacterium]|nr:7-cyano-7-deazaguanine synthase [Saprospiraceae bacterium]